MESDINPAESQVLAERLVTNEQEAAAEIFRRYVRRLTALARARLAPQVGRRVDPEDAVQSAFRSFFIGARSGRFTIKRSGDLWRLLATITARKVSRLTTHHRGAKRAVNREVTENISAQENDLDFLTDRLPSPAEAAALADELLKIMQDLPPQQRRVLQLRLVDATVDEIARELNCTDRTIRRRLSDLQAVFERRFGNASPEPVAERRPPIADDKNDPGFSAVPNPLVASRSDGALPTVDYRDLVLESHLGTGGMGRVYRAWQRSTDHYVAVKVLKKRHQNHRAAVDQFLAEAELIAGLNHPGIIRLHGVGRMPGGGHYFTMQLVEAGDLQQENEAGVVSPSRIVPWLQQAAAAVAYAHSRGIIHCDLKPSNLLLDRDDRIVVSDFGFAVALTGKKQPLGGTIEFVAPELLDDRYDEVCEKTDVWGLGAILYALLYRTSPWPKTMTKNMPGRFGDDAIDFTLPTPSLPLTEIARRCLAIDPEERYADTKAVADALEATKSLRS